ncbi:hypothetical protein LguiB_009773 [Lonicera macranthoides]
MHDVNMDVDLEDKDDDKFENTYENGDESDELGDVDNRTLNMAMGWITRNCLMWRT